MFLNSDVWWNYMVIQTFTFILLWQHSSNNIRGSLTPQLKSKQTWVSLQTLFTKTCLGLTGQEFNAGLNSLVVCSLVVCWKTTTVFCYCMYFILKASSNHLVTSFWPIFVFMTTILRILIIWGHNWYVA